MGDMATAIMTALAVPAIGFIAWAAHLQFRVTSVERAQHLLDSQQKIILRGLVRLGVIRQEEVDDIVDDAAKA